MVKAFYREVFQSRQLKEKISQTTSLYKRFLKEIDVELLLNFAKYWRFWRQPLKMLILLSRTKSYHLHLKFSLRNSRLIF
jgi:hypothetical protein